MEGKTGTIEVDLKVLEAINSAPSGLDILRVCLDIAEFLAVKNTAYGNSVLDPVRIFSTASTEEQIKIRLDDKMSRLIRGGNYPGDDDYRDILGYLVMYYVNKIQGIPQKEDENSSEIKTEDWVPEEEVYAPEE